MCSAIIKTDQELLLLIKEGDRDAFTQLYHRYSLKLYKNLLPLIKLQTIAEEIIQDIFVKVWEKRSYIQIEGDVASYLYRIGKNLVYDFFRLAAQDKELREQLYYLLNSDSSDIDLDIILKEDSITRAIASLPPQRQRIFRLCKLEGKSYLEVSILLGISVATVNDHIVKATKTIQKNISNEALTILYLLLLFQDLSGLYCIQ